MRILVTGYPNSGKTTIAKLLAATGEDHNIIPMSTDSLIDKTSEWSELSEIASNWFDKPGPCIIEGVAVPRAIRKWRTRHPRGKPPFDIFVFIRRPLAGYLPGQVAMAKGIETVMLGLWTWIGSAGVRIYELGPTEEEK
jgi:hypothetical protein